MNMRSFIENLTLFICTCIICYAAVEIPSFVILRFQSSGAEDTILGDNVLDMEHNSDLGWQLIANNTQHARKYFKSGKTIYDVVYHTDQYHRRTVGQHYDVNNPHVILFGCSRTYGEGLPDKETLQYLLGEALPDYNIFNYGVPGYGPQQTLALLESGKLPEQVFSKHGYAIYNLADSHIERAIFTTQTWWLREAPYYRLTPGGIERQASFATGAPIRTSLVEFLSWSYDHSNLLRLIKFHYPLRLTSSDAELVYRIIAAARNNYEQQFQGTFVVAVDPTLENSGQMQNLIALLRERGIPMIYKPISKKWDLSIPGDGHPSLNFNKYQAGVLADYIIREKQPKF